MSDQMAKFAGRSWADLCESSQSSQSLGDSSNVCGDNGVPREQVDACRSADEDNLYDVVFQSVGKEKASKAAAAAAKPVTHNELSLTSFMNNVHMVTPVKQENVVPPPPSVIDEDTICSPFVKKEPKDEADVKPEPPGTVPIHLTPKTERVDDKSELQHAKRRLTSESSSTASDALTPERANKFHKKSSEHTNIHDSVRSAKLQLERETDPLILARRQKQIDFGKNTIGYEKYLEQVPKHQRKKHHPKTPPKNLKYNRRAWDGLVKNWRIKLHCWDPDCKKDDDDALTTGSSSNLCSLGSMSSLDSNSQVSDSRPSSPLSEKRPSEALSQVKHEAVLSSDPVEFKKSRTENK